MPGLSFLFKKKFHPSRSDNQKAIFIAQNTREQKNDREHELALQVMKEREMQGYEGLGQAPDRDPRATSLKFMYAAPASVKDKKASVGLLAVPAAPVLDENGDDEAVRAFKAKLYHKDVPVLCPSSSSVPMEAAADGGVEDEVEDLGVGRVYPQRTELEKLSGISARPLLTAAELAQRHPVLRNAPTEGSYTHGLSLQHKPFNDPIRNVRCLRCGLWGHVSGDRECKQKDLNPRDRDRLVREDPMKGQLERDEDSSDPEGAFLATLTRREKKLLLRKLQRLEGGEAEAGAGEEKKKRKKSKHRKKESKHDNEHKSKRPRKQQAQIAAAAVIAARLQTELF